MRNLLAEYKDIKEPRNVGLISLSHGINEFYGLAFPPIIPLLVADLNITYAQAGLLLTIFYVMYSIFQLPAGLLADRIGKKRLLIWGLVGMAGGLAIASTAQNYEMLLVAQALMGISGSTYHPTGMAMLSDTETKETEGKAMGVFGLGGMAGIASAPVIIGGIAALVNWRTALLVAAGLGFVVTIVFQLTYRTPQPATDGGREQPSDTQRRHSSGGENDRGTDRETSDEHTGSPMTDDSPPLSGNTPLVDRIRTRFEQMFRFEITPSIVLLCVVVLLVSLQIRSIQTFATGFLADGVGRSTSTANGIFFVMLSASAVSSIWVGSLADRLDRGLVGLAAAVATSVLLLAAFAVFVTGSIITGWLLTGVLAVVFGLLGLAVYGCTPVKNALISEYATADSSGSLFGVTQTASAAGSASGPALFGYVATEFSIEYAFPMIAVVGIVIAAGFYGLARN